jgi:calreticulin
MLVYWLALLAAVSGPSLAKVLFKEDFDSEGWNERWVQTKFPGKEFGPFDWTSGKFYGDADKDKGIKTGQDARFYGLSTKFEDKAFSNKGKDLVIQFSVKHEQSIDCGGGYLKVFDCSLNPEQLNGDSPYQIMFGPDICGYTKKVHLIFSYKGKNLEMKKQIECPNDVHTHVYRMHVKPDNTYEVAIDGEVKQKGDLESDWDFLPEKKIPDPEAKKPEDWVDEAEIPDPEDKKPQDWEQPETSPDPEAQKPADWDDEMDGEWEPPQIDNPQYKGKWEAKRIPNPLFKGPWVHPEVDNPEYAPDADLYLRPEICALGFDLWQVKSGTIFDNVLMTDDVTEAQAASDEILKRVKIEKEAHEKAEKEKKVEDPVTADPDEDDPAESDEPVEDPNDEEPVPVERKTEL